MGNGQLDLSGFAGYEDIVAFAFNYRTNSTWHTQILDISSFEICS